MRSYPMCLRPRSPGVCKGRFRKICRRSVCFTDAGMSRHFALSSYAGTRAPPMDDDTAEQVEPTLSGKGRRILGFFEAAFFTLRTDGTSGRSQDFANYMLPFATPCMAPGFAKGRWKKRMYMYAYIYIILYIYTQLYLHIYIYI